MKKVVWKILSILRIAGPIQLLINSSIRDSGWFKSYYSKESVDYNNTPIPWFTYPAIEFLKSRLSPDMFLFEYGCGNSSIWFGSRVAKVVSVEHNADWFNKVKAKMPSNALLILKEFEDSKDYADSIFETATKYDLVIIDGVDRNNCVYSSLKCLSERGVIIYDNSDRYEYKDSIDFLIRYGFKKLDFFGMGPVTSINSCTSIFYRENNCLGI